MSINKSSQFSVRRSTLNDVQGNQLNDHRIVAQVVNFNSNQVERECTETKYDEFQYIKRGDIISVRDLYSEELKEWEWGWEYGQLPIGRKHKSRKTICTVEIHPNREHKFTAVIYEGDNAHAFWEEDFQQLSCLRNPGSAQLFGVNRSDVPMLIFHHELILLGHFYKQSFWGDIYLLYLQENKMCRSSALWMDSKGTLCSGPDGPSFSIGRYVQPPLEPFPVPSTRDMLERDNSFRFFAQFRSKDLDMLVLYRAQEQCEYTYLDGFISGVRMTEDRLFQDGDQFDWGQEYPCLEGLFLMNALNQPVMDIVRKLRFDTIYSNTLDAVARWPQNGGRLWHWWTMGTSLVDQKLIGDKLTRFKLVHCEEFTLENEFSPQELSAGFLAQSPRIIEALGITGEEERCFMIEPPWLQLQSTMRSSHYDGLAAFFRLCDTEKAPPVFLFLCPHPMCVSELILWLGGYSQTHFWSFDETGQTQLSDEECEELGLPQLTPSLNDPYEVLKTISWPAHSFKPLYDWQTTQGYDPMTADFARRLWYPEYEIIDARLGRPEQEKQQLASWWEAIPGSGISAFGF